MPKAPKWTEQEFEELLRNPDLSDEELVAKVGHSPGAVGVVRNFVHNFHRGLNISGLSQMMIRRLKSAPWVCPVCKEWICPVCKGL